jgi:hypothetical protein
MTEAVQEAVERRRISAASVGAALSAAMVRTKAGIIYGCYTGIGK